ncbi:hypothetical protein HCH_05787 [Hahella chejuensis KCTC 2396]|uniref:Uncharacterized protein n=1 Tax=Hahella chejuensis (strain KCTC 2396) TaxID=349521 RepID=Q2SA86_HAHCH|nr:hypothetical protein [Hahella chejuensis]ABC32438.1 hypothetical protein HCH_05787 [Hahella chejuensis KCTC 2396]
MKNILQGAALGLILAGFFAANVQAQENLTVKVESAKSFSGAYQVGEDRVEFASSLGRDALVEVSVKVNGATREAAVYLEKGDIQSASERGFSSEEETLMFDAANALAEYLSASREDIESPALMLVGVMDYWSSRTN